MADVPDASKINRVYGRLVFWHDRQTSFEHDASLLWSRNRVVYWVRWDLEEAP